MVGGAGKVEACRELGADVVIDKSSEDLWAAARAASGPEGFAAVFDANGVSTLRASYEALARCGRLVVYGFHSNLPMGSDMLRCELTLAVCDPLFYWGSICGLF